MPPPIYSSTFFGPTYKGDMIFPVTNEEPSKITEKLEEFYPAIVKDKRHTWVGVSLMDNLDKAAAAGVSWIECIDLSNNVQSFWNELRPIILETMHYLEAQALVNKLMQKYKPYFSPSYPRRIDPFQILKRDIQEQTSWLSNEIYYNRIREIFFRQ